MLFSKTIGGNYISLKVNSSDVQSTIETVEVKWKEMFPDSPFDYFLLDEKYNQQYRADQHFSPSNCRFFGIGCFHCLSRTLWAFIIYHCASHTGDWHPESLGSFRIPDN